MILSASPVALVRNRWRHALHPAFVVHDVSDRTELEQTLSVLRPAVLLLDVGLVKNAPVESLAAVHRVSPATRIIVMSTMPSAEEGSVMLKAGARGYCHRVIDGGLLRKAVEVVQQGEIWAGRALTSRLLEELAARIQHSERNASIRAAERLQRLTPREREIALLVGGGASNKEIGGKLGITERTVKAHLTAVFRKLGVSDRLRLALFVNDLDNVPPGR
jgi:DNA-binding NarL/FixJ family response regulator